MSLNLRNPSDDDGTTVPAHTHKITRSFAMLVLLALVALFALRHLFGSFSVEAGVR